MVSKSLWITGTAGSGKTTMLVEQFRVWIDARKPREAHPLQQSPGALIFTATGDTRLILTERLATAIAGKCPIHSTTPLGFFQDEVTLFWPLLVEKLGLKPLFPLRLRSETEQELATQVWRPELEQGLFAQPGVNSFRMVRRSLDFLLLAASGEIPTEDIALILQDGFSRIASIESPALVEESGFDRASDSLPELWTLTGQLLERWRDWCLQRGFLTYGILSELYWRHLLPDALYQSHLKRRFRAIFADDVDEYPAIVRTLFNVLMDSGVSGVFTYNPQGSVKLGFSADPLALQDLSGQCDVIELPASSQGLATMFGESLVNLVRHGNLNAEIKGFSCNGFSCNGLNTAVSTSMHNREVTWGDDRAASHYDRSNSNTVIHNKPFRLIEETSRAQLLRKLTTVIIQAIQSNHIAPHEIAIIGPGIDAIARYTLMEIFTKQGIPIQPLTEQRPLIQAPMVRALLTLLALIYPGLGRLIDRDQVAEMLVSLSSVWSPELSYRIDAVRAGLLVDHCYVPDAKHPKLLKFTAFPRWDRLGHRTAQTYQTLLEWMTTRQRHLVEGSIVSPITILDQAIQDFLWNGSYLPYDQLAAIRALLETAHHYWEVEARLVPELNPSEPDVLRRFIQVLRGGMITANPYPIGAQEVQEKSITLASLFQYRLNRCSHRWQFWLDVGSADWLTKGGGLFGAALFLQGGLQDGLQVNLQEKLLGNLQTNVSGNLQGSLSENLWENLSENPGEDLQEWRPLSGTFQVEAIRLQQTLVDLSGRTECVFLCHSELATNGQEQLGPLLPLVYAVGSVDNQS